MSKSERYREAGVDIDKANLLVERIKSRVRSTFTSSVITDIGGFSGLVSLPLDRYDKPVLVSSTDGVGTKLKIAFMTGKHDTIGIDLVAMCVNDILVCGARPLFFLDYLSMGKLDEELAEQIIEGIALGCEQAKCPLVGGETAEMPGFYPSGEYDLAGFVVGLVDNDKIIDGTAVGVGHKVIGLASSGLHSNGYSLVRKLLLDDLKMDLDSTPDFLERPLGEELLEPTRIYVETVRLLTRDFSISGMAHITGGGILDNLPRILPNGLMAVIDRSAWETPPIFTFMQEKGDISDEEMLTTFNSGLGLVVCLPEAEAEEALERLTALGEKAWLIGEIAARGRGKPVVEVAY